MELSQTRENLPLLLLRNWTYSPTLPQPIVAAYRRFDERLSQSTSTHQFHVGTVRQGNHPPIVSIQNIEFLQERGRERERM